MPVGDFEKYLQARKPAEEFRDSYLPMLKVPREFEEKLKKACEVVEKASVVTTQGEGRSGDAAKIIAAWISDVSPYSERDSRFADDIGAMNPSRLGQEGAVGIMVSGSGTTREVVDLARELKEHDNYIISFTSNKDSTLGEMSDLVLETPRSSKEVAVDYSMGNTKLRSYEASQLAKPEPADKMVTSGKDTMGDRHEETVLCAGYSIASGLAGKGASPNSVIDYLIDFLSDEAGVGDYNYLAKVIYHEAGDEETGQLILDGKGPSADVASMVVNRAVHYRINLRSLSSPDRPAMKDKKGALFISSSARDLKQEIETLRGLNYHLRGQKKGPYVCAVTGRHADWLEKCDGYVVLGDSPGRDYKFVREPDGTPEKFYALASIFLNSVMRAVANYKGIGEASARYYHPKF